MGAVLWGWAAAAIVLAAVIAAIGLRPKRAVSSVLGILIDGRGRYSMTRLQMVLWTWLVLSLVGGVFIGRAVHEISGGTISNALAFTVPGGVLAAMGISLGSSVVSTAIKRSTDTERPQTVAASRPGTDEPRFSQVYLSETGPFADNTVDVGKFQNLIITLVLVASYAVQALVTIRHDGTAAKLTSLPDFNSQFLALLGISHAGYLGSKVVPSSPDAVPAGLTLQDLYQETPPAVRPRNPANQDAPPVPETLGDPVGAVAAATAAE
jgi:hypothetical protein